MKNNWSPDIYSKAWNFASLHHRGQTYGGPKEGMQVDYVNHIGSVSIEVIWALSSDPDKNANLAIQCALLHDIIEDTKVSYEDVVENFGKEIAQGVLALTKNSSLPKKLQMEDSLKRIKQQPKEVWIVKMADRITNLYHPAFYWKNKKIVSYRQEAILIYENLKDAHVALAKRLSEKIEEYKKFII